MSLPFYQTMIFRALIGSFLLLIMLFGGYTYVAVVFHTDQMMAQVLDNAARISEIIKKSTRYSMLAGRNSDAYEIMKTIGEESGVDGIRIYSKAGMIVFSTSRAEAGKHVDRKEEQCSVCHANGTALQAVPAKDRFRYFSLPTRRYRTLGLIDPIRNEPACSGGSCHAHPSDKTVLGVLDVRMSLEKVDADIRAARKRLMLYAVIGTAIAMMASGLYLFATVHRPVKRLREGTRQISTGNLDFRIPLASKDEIGALARAFNEMTQSLQKAEQENRLWSQTLEKRVEEKTAELKQIHNQILQIEKMASLGRLSATVAHELNNPLEGILNYAKLISRRLKKAEATPAVSSALEDLELIISEVQRCGNIVKSLLLFSKRQVGEFGMVPVAAIVDRAVRLVQHHFRMSDVSFHAEIADPDATLLCDENQIEQALVALFVNAVEAMPHGGDLKLTVGRETSGGIRMEIADTGAGIAAADLPRLFEPFFTTKQEGKGVGLGLSVVYGILKRHEGTVSVQSEPGAGTKFTLRFPPAATRQPGVEAEGATS
jgi:two-component system NtrC family sensor kinase